MWRSTWADSPSRLEKKGADEVGSFSGRLRRARVPNGTARRQPWSPVGCGFAAALRCRLRRRILGGDYVAWWVHARDSGRLDHHPPHDEPVLDGVNEPLHAAAQRSVGLVDTIYERIPYIIVGDGQGCLRRGLLYRVMCSLQQPLVSGIRIVTPQLGASES